MHKHLKTRLRRFGSEAVLDRRQALARLGLGASVAYVAPLLLSLGEARASGGDGGDGGGGGGGSGGGGSGADGGGAAGGGSSAGSSGPSGPAAGGTDTGSTGGTGTNGADGSTGVIGDPTGGTPVVTDPGTTVL